MQEGGSRGPSVDADIISGMLLAQTGLYFNKGYGQIARNGFNLLSVWPAGTIVQSFMLPPSI